MTRVTIAGASGYVGKNLLKQLEDSELVIKGLSRSNRESGNPKLSWVSADLFSYQSSKEALQDTDIAIYLVHSMMPSTRLFQGDFQDADLLIADNFARACKSAGVKQIIYLGGLLPKSDVSKHLESRREVEDVFKATGIPVTVLRAGMIAGDGGSSFEILKNLVFNLPGMVLPKWTESKTQAIFIDDLTKIVKVSINNSSFFDKTIDVVNGESITYKDLILKTSKYFNKKKILFSLPINSTSFSKLWVKIFGETDYELVSPLIDSLTCDLPTPDVDPLIEPFIKYKTYDDMLKRISPEKLVQSKTKVRVTEKTVRSIQRLENPSNLSGKELSDHYIDWLPAHLKSLLIAKQDGDKIGFYAYGLSKPLLVLRHIEDESSSIRDKFHIVGGLLSQTSNTGWLEFRIVADGKYTLASINDFVPSLPWYIYKFTQAPIHAAVMKSFGEYLTKK
ncbi:MAG: epimerase [Halobacteriovorax sp.]|nr:epimerase [Halobacteriovorax sp.]|tara:strand:+ start:39765 stop:41111 length:1347 start_codon:yes stop_codon:yes gene_type:complete